MDHYKVLDVSKDATAEEIRVAYKKLALKWHPDRHTTDKENAQQKFIEIHEAYRVLTEKKEWHRSKTEDDPQSSGSSSTCSTSDSSTPPSSPAPSMSDHHSSESYTTPPSSPKPGTDSSGSRSFSHESFNVHNSHTHETPLSSPASPDSSNHKSPSNPASDSRTSSSDPRGHDASRHRSDRETPSDSKSGSSSNFKSHGSSGIKGGSDTHLRSKSFPSHDDHRSKRLSTPKALRSKLRKQSKPTLRRPDQNPRAAQSAAFSPIYGSYPRGAGDSKEWRCPIKLTLEELFEGKCLRYHLTRYLLSNKKKHVIVDIDVPPGCRPGSQIICPGIGHQRRDGSLQDIVFVIEEVPHARFCRLRKNGEDLGMEVKLPWVKALEREKGEVHFKGIDGKDISVKIDYPNDRQMEGTHVVVGAGMPFREGKKGKTRRRGDLVVRWEIVSTPTSTWEALKHKVLHFKY